MITFPNAKINLGLDIIEKRKDGYHNLNSCFYPVGLADVLEILENSKFRFEQTGIPVEGKPEENLVVRAYRLLSKDFDIPPVSIHLHKLIPTGAGLGGGSSDAAHALRLMNTLFELFLDESILADYALQLGSDCPFFIYNRPMFASGRGEILDDASPVLKGRYLYLVKPREAVSTREAYQGIIPFFPEIPIQEILQEPLTKWKTSLKNDFEAAVFRKLPVLEKIRDALYESGAVYAAMTGSGSALYGVFEEQPENIFTDREGYFEWIGEL